MNEQMKKSLLSKREEGNQRIRQAEADLYFLQGYQKAVEDMLQELEMKEPEEVKDQDGEP